MDPSFSKRTSHKSRPSSSVIGRTRSVTMPTVFFLPDAINRLCLSPACSFFAPCRMGFSLFFSTRMEKTPIQTKEREIPLFHHPSLYHCFSPFCGILAKKQRFFVLFIRFFFFPGLSLPVWQQFSHSCYRAVCKQTSQQQFSSFP